VGARAERPQPTASHQDRAAHRLTCPANENHRLSRSAATSRMASNLHSSVTLPHAGRDGILVAHDLFSHRSGILSGTNLAHARAPNQAGALEC
jgi:hypothetical protein